MAEDQQSPPLSTLKNASFPSKEKNDQVILLEEGRQSEEARIHLIEEAKESIQIAYYTLHQGMVTDTFLSLLIKAADRGVQVNIILDGIFHNLRGHLKDVIYIFLEHPNIHLKYYEPFSLLKPWTWNNRLHDKLMIVDDQYAIIGGRNIGDKYFSMAKATSNVKDRDVLIISQPKNRTSIIDNMKAYFSKLWKHEFTKNQERSLTKRQQKKGINKRKELLKKLDQRKKDDPLLFKQEMNWDALAIKVDHIQLIHNPLQRLNKEPTVWKAISKLITEAKTSVTIESPYVIPTKEMMRYIEEITIPTEQINIITNSLYASPNPLAFSGYLENVDLIQEKGFNLQEYKGPDSIHSKTFVIDQKLSIIGSFNLDARSTFLSTESVVVIYGEEFAEKLQAQIENRLSKPIPKENNGSFLWLKKILLKGLSKLTTFYHHLLTVVATVYQS